MDKDVEGRDMGGKGVIFEVDAHRLDSLGVPFQFAELEDVLVVHLWWPDCLEYIDDSIHGADKEQQHGNAIRHYSEGSSISLHSENLCFWIIIFVLNFEILECHAPHVPQHNHHNDVEHHDYGDSCLQTENETAVSTHRDVLSTSKRLYLGLQHEVTRYGVVSMYPSVV